MILSQIFKAAFQTQHSGWNCLFVCKLVNLQALRNVDGFLSSINKCRNNTTRQSDWWPTFPLQEQFVYQSSPFPWNYRRRRLLGGNFKIWMFSAPPMASPPLQMPFYLQICIFRENLCSCILMFLAFMSWAPCEVLSPFSEKETGKKWLTRGHAGFLESLGQCTALLTTAFHLWPSQLPLALPSLGWAASYRPSWCGLMLVSGRSFCSSSTRALHTLQVCPSVPFQTCRNPSMNC